MVFDMLQVLENVNAFLNYENELIMIICANTAL